MLMKNIFGKMVNIIWVNLKIIYHMEKESNTIQMEIFYTKAILLMINLKEMENIFMRMVDILQDNIKKV